MAPTQTPITDTAKLTDLLTDLGRKGLAAAEQLRDTARMLEQPICDDLVAAGIKPNRATAYAADFRITLRQLADIYDQAVHSADFAVEHVAQIVGVVKRGQREPQAVK